MTTETTTVSIPVPSASAAQDDRRTTRALPSPRVLEARLARAIPLSPNSLSLAKLLLVLPLLLALEPVALIPGGAALLLPLFALFAALDYLDGVVARARGLQTELGRWLDRLTDYPILLALGFFCMDLLPVGLVVAKLALDALLMLLFVLGKGSTRNRLRTTLSYATLFALLSVSQGWSNALITPAAVSGLLWVSITVSATIALRNLGVLRSRRIADALSVANLLCGGIGMYFAAEGKLGVSLLMLCLGAALDGLDGAAARRWGGSRLGVLMDDIADGFSYGIAPGFAIHATMPGSAASMLGGAFALFVVGRLVFFTLSKSSADPNYFSGAPSTLGGLVVLCALILFQSEPLLVGAMVGVACTLMVSFDTHYRHLGRALTARRATIGAPLYVGALLLGAQLGGLQGAVALVLVGNLAYGFFPTATRFAKALKQASSDPLQGVSGRPLQGTEWPSQQGESLNPQ